MKIVILVHALETHSRWAEPLRKFGEVKIVRSSSQHLPEADIVINRFGDVTEEMELGIPVLRIYEERKTRMINSSRRILDSASKVNSAFIAVMHGIPHPRTRFNWKNVDFGFPIVVKAEIGHGGKQVFLTMNQEDLRRVLLTNKEKPSLFQEFVSCEIVKDLRVVVAQNIYSSRYHIVTAFERFAPKGSFKANIQSGGWVSDPIELSEPQKATVLKCAEAFGLGLVGFDFVYNNGNENDLIFIEANSRPGCAAWRIPAIVDTIFE